MGKLKNDLLAQLKSSNSKNAKDCLRIYNKLMELESGVWDSRWNVLVNTRFEGTYPNSRRISSPSSIGKIFLAGLQDKKNKVMTEEQFKRTTELYDRLRALNFAKIEISDMGKHPLCYVYKNSNDDYTRCPECNMRPIREILNKHDKMIREEIDEEIRKLQEEIKTL